MKRVVYEQRLGFFPTVFEEGSADVSSKGTTCVLDDRLLFADIRSPTTAANIRRGLAVEVNDFDTSLLAAQSGHFAPGETEACGGMKAGSLLVRR